MHHLLPPVSVTKVLSQTADPEADKHGRGDLDSRPAFAAYGPGGLGAVTMLSWVQSAPL